MWVCALNRQGARVKRKLSNICIILGAALVIGGLSLFLWNQWDNYRAGEASDEILAQPEGLMDADSSSSDSGMTEVELDGNVYIGYITIPALGKTLPVMSEWSYEHLRIAPCRYFGSVETNDLVIAAHNYATHFGGLSNLVPGDKVYFTDLDGTTWSYEVVEVDTLSPTAVEEMTDSGYDLTLFTCTYGGQSRVTVRCDKA